MARDYRVSAIQTAYASCRFRSRIEARWAVFFDCMGIPYEYEPDGYFVAGAAYLPDFYLRKQHLFVEVKPDDPTPEEIDKATGLAVETEREVIIAMGGPQERFQLIRIAPSGVQYRGLWVWAWDRNPRAGPHLVSEDDSQWLGGGDGHALPTKRPMFSGALEDAYATAKSARFESTKPRYRFEPIAWDAERAANEDNESESAA